MPRSESCEEMRGDLRGDDWQDPTVLVRRAKKIKQIARELHVARNTVLRAIRDDAPASEYIRRNQPRPKLGRYLPLLERLLEEDESRSASERRCAQRLFEVLRLAGYSGAADSVARYVRQ